MMLIMLQGEIYHLRVFITNNQSTHVTDGVNVTSLSASPQHNTRAATDRLRQIALNRILSLIRKEMYMFNAR